MPVMDGFSVLRALGKERPAKMPRVVMVSAYSYADAFEEALSLGAVDYINTPFDPAFLKKVVKEVLDPSLDNAQLVAQAKLRRVLFALQNIAGALAYREVLEGLNRLPLGELSPASCRELRACLLAAAQDRLLKSPKVEELVARGRATSPGVEPALTLLALARVL
jgi:CheY-like chemotaxis protein